MKDAKRLPAAVQAIRAPSRCRIERMCSDLLRWSFGYGEAATTEAGSPSERIQSRFHGGSVMKFRNEMRGGDFDGTVPVTTLDVATATRIVAIDLQEFNAGENAQGRAEEERDPLVVSDLPPQHRPMPIAGRGAETPPLTRKDMLEAFSALREARRDRHEDDMVIDAIIEDARPNSLIAAIERT
jgi:hypothetical protein